MTPHKALDHVTSNEEHVRLKIFEGDLKIDEAPADLLRIERAQNAALWLKYVEMADRCTALRAALEKATRGQHD